MSMYTGQQTDRPLTRRGMCERSANVCVKERGRICEGKKKEAERLWKKKGRDDLIHKSSSSRAFLFCSTSPRTTRYCDIYTQQRLVGITTADSKSFFRSSGRLDRIRTIDYINLIVARVALKPARDLMD